MGPNVAAVVGLMLVTDDRLLGGRDLVQLARAAQHGGITALQVRLKQSLPRDLAELVRNLVAALEVPVLVNDRPDVAIAAGAAGTHLGPDDLPLDLARRIAPPGFILGASVGSEAEAQSAEAADYWGIGPWRTSTTKDDAGPGLGPDGFRRLVQRAGPRPCIAIGGVLPDDIPRVLQMGGVGVAVVSGILAQEDVSAAASRYAERLKARGSG